MLTKWNDRSLNRFFDDFFGKTFPTLSQDGEWLDSKENYQYRLEIPGYSTDEIKVEMKDSTLTVEGKREKKSEFTSESSSFYISTLIPSNANGNAVEAIHENGVLLLKFPKREADEKRVKQIAVKSGKSA